MHQGIYKITKTEPIARDVFRTVLSGDTGSITHPGQFINIKLDGFFLRRPISICDWQEGEITIIYKTVGGGTRALSQLDSGAELDILCGLGNGFDPDKSGDAPLLIGGGVGVPPIYGLCRRLVAQGKNPQVILGFTSAADVFYKEEFESLGAAVTVTTNDGSYGTKGFVTDAMQQISDYTYFYTCGPEPMLRAVCSASRSDGEMSFEEHMGCGFGACMGCSCETLTGYKRICKEGPVMGKGEIKW